MSMTQAERISSLEMEVSYLREDIRSMNESVKELLAFRNRGIGAFWLASALFGTSVIGLVTLVIGWIKG